MRKILYLLIAVLLLSSCGGDSFDGKTVYLTKHHFYTYNPSYVNFYIQATDKNKRGVANLTNEDFTLEENDQFLSLVDSELEIVPTSGIDYTMRVVLLIDNGSSAREEISKVKEATKNLINRLPIDVEIAVYTFARNVNKIADFTKNKTLLSTAIDDIVVADNSTNLYGAVVECASSFKDLYTEKIVSQGVLVVYTDGSDNQGSVAFTQVETAIKNKRIYTVGNLSGYLDQKLPIIGTAGYFKIRNINDLDAKFNFVSDEIINYKNSFYWLRYSSPKINNKNNKVELSINNSSKYRGSNKIEAYFEGFKQ